MCGPPHPPVQLTLARCRGRVPLHVCAVGDALDAVDAAVRQPVSRAAAEDARHIHGMRLRRALVLVTVFLDGRRAGHDCCGQRLLQRY